MNLPLVWHADYAPAELPHFARLRTVAELAVAEGLGHLHAPQALAPERLRGLHDDAYVDAVLAGRAPLAGSAGLEWSPQLVAACLRMLGGQLLGTTLALAHGRCVHLACGFHHAHPGIGGGFCVFNGLALVAHAHPQLQVAVLDCDEHGGDGTEAFAQRLPNLRALSIFGSRFGLRGEGRSRALKVPGAGTAEVDQYYLEVLDQALADLLADPPGLVLYQAGMDAHIDDPRATLRVSTATLGERDRRVFAALRSAGVPVLAVLAGAYQAPARVAALYRGLLRAAAA